MTARTRAALIARVASALAIVLLVAGAAHADTVGLFNVVSAMKRFAANPHDDQKFWQPAPLLARLAAEGKSFS